MHAHVRLAAGTSPCTERLTSRAQARASARLAPASRRCGTATSSRLRTAPRLSSATARTGSLTPSAKSPPAPAGGLPRSTRTSCGSARSRTTTRTGQRTTRSASSKARRTLSSVCRAACLAPFPSPPKATRPAASRAWHRCCVILTSDMPLRALPRTGSSTQTCALTSWTPSFFLTDARIGRGWRSAWRG